MPKLLICKPVFGTVTFVFKKEHRKNEIKIHQMIDERIFVTDESLQFFHDEFKDFISEKYKNEMKITQCW